MKPTHRAASAAAALMAALTASASVAGCSSNSAAPQASCGAPDGLVIAVGAHQGVAAPALPGVLKCPITAALEAGKPISLIQIDGTPSAVLSAKRFDITPASDSETLHGDDLTAAITTITTAVRSMTPDANGDDVYAAFALSVDVARSAGTPHATIYIVDSGLADRGPVNLTVPGALGAEPAEYVAYLRSTKQLVDAAGLTVVPISFGYSSAPQEPLSAADREAVLALYKAIFTASGATAGPAVPAPRNKPGPKTRYVTTPIPLTRPAAPRFTDGETLSYDSTSALRFRPDSTQLLDPPAAAAELHKLANFLAAHPATRVTITGTTASVGSEESRLAFGKARANAVQGLLTGSLHVKPAQITTAGCVTSCVGTVEDVLPNGQLDPPAAAVNRSIHIQVHR